MLRRPPNPDVPPEAVEIMIQQGQLQLNNMIAFNSPDDPPFLCLPGIREYHDNPAHSGDSWLLHRASGEGSLAFILDKICSYGVNPIEQYRIELQTVVRGFTASLQAIPA
jgi:hypothetical protein